MLAIQEMFFPVNQFSRPGKKLVKVKGIVMHYTASKGAPAVNIAKYFGRLKDQNPNDNVADRYASAHFAVDDSNIVAALPYKLGAVEMGYHVGSTTYTAEALSKLSKYPNDCTVGIELCIDANGNITEKTFQNAADLVAYLCKLYGLNESNVWTHKGVVGWKDCPLPWVQKPSEFTRFKAEVAKRLRPAPVAPPKPPTPKPPTPPTPGIKSVGKIKVVNVNSAAIVMDKPDRLACTNVGTLAKGTVIDISGSVKGKNSADGYWEVIFKGKRAYINGKFGVRV